MSASNEQDTLLEFPTPFPVKIMGEAGAGLEVTVIDIVRRHDSEFAESNVEMRMSSGGKYISLTVTVTATSRAMLDALYRELSSHPQIKYVL